MADGAFRNHSHQSRAFARLEAGFFPVFLQRRQLFPASGFGFEFRDSERNPERAGRPAVLGFSGNWLWSVVAGPVDFAVLRAGPSHRGARQFDC